MIINCNKHLSKISVDDQNALEVIEKYQYKIINLIFPYLVTSKHNNQIILDIQFTQGNQ